MRYRFGGFELDPREGSLRRDGEALEVQPKVIDALALFIGRAGQLVTRDEILEALWPDVHVSDDALQQMIRKLRKALGDDAKVARFLETVPRRGYRFIAPVTPAADPGDESAVEPAPAAPESESSPRVPAEAERPAQAPTVVVIAPADHSVRRRRRRWPMAGAAGVVLALALALVVAVRMRARPPAMLHRGACAPGRLTHSPEREQEGAFIGKSIVFVANDPDQGQYDLFVTSRAGDGRLRLTHTPGDEFYPQAAPDGDAILFSRGDVDGLGVWEIGLSGGPARLVVADACCAAYSPDGRELAYLRPRADHAVLLVRARSGGAEREVARVAATAASVAWSPDGRSLAFVDGRRVWTVAVAGGAPRPASPLASHLRTVTWAGRALVSDGNFTGRGGLWWMVPGRPPQSITTNTGGQYHPAVAGADLLYTSEKRQQQIYVDSGEGVRRVSTTTTLDCLDVAADGRRVAFTDYDPTAGGREAEVVVQDVDNEARDVLGAGRCPRFSPDGARVAYLRRDGGDEVLWVHPGGRFGPETVRPIDAPAWDRDGRSLVVATASGLVRVTAAAVSELAPGRFGRVDVAADGVVAATRDDAVLLIGAGGELTRLAIRASYENPPTWTAGGLTVLAAERTRPLLITYDRGGRELAREAVRFEADPSFWGVFEARRFDGGWAFVQTRYESDLYVLGDCVR